MCVVIPARNEADGVGECVGSLLRQDYRGLKSVVLVDDESTDGTADVARRAAAACGAADRLTIVPGTPLPKGWTGKLWAMRQGIAAAMASETPPDYLLLTDADIVYEPHVLSWLVAHACAKDLVLASFMVSLRCQTAAERGLIPAFIFFFQMLYPFSRVNRPADATAAAAGGCMLVQGRRAATGGRDRCDPQRPDRRLRARRPSQGQGADLARPDVAGAQPARISPLVGRRAHGVADGLCATALFAADAGWNGRRPHARLSRAAALPRCSAPASPAASASPPGRSWRWRSSRRLRFYRLSPWWGFALPAIAAAYLVFTVQSAIASIRGKGGLWKGRFQAAGAK